MPALTIRALLILVLLVTAGETGTTWAENLFPGATFPIGPSPIASAAGDMNGDGLVDLVTSDDLAGGPSQAGLGGIIVLINRGDGTFEPPRTTTEVRTRPIVLADADGDGDLEVIFPFGSGLGLRRNRGDGTFGPRETYGAGSTTSSTGMLTVADFNHDGRPDVASIKSTTNPPALRVDLYLGTGFGFSSARQLQAGARPFAVAAADFNRDGYDDLAASGSCATGDAACSQGEIAVLLGHGDGTFDAAVLYGAGPGAGGLQAGDFDGDGIPDLVVGNTGPVASVLFGNGDGTFGARFPVALGFDPFDVTVADFDGDHLDDLAMFGEGRFAVVRGARSGPFPIGQAGATGGLPQTMSAADFNSDGKPDLAIGHRAASLGYDPGSAAIFLGDGTGEFRQHVLFTDDRPTALVANDLNEDGRIDLVVVMHDGGGAVFQNQGRGILAEGPSFEAGSNPSAAVAGDFNRDGHGDLAVANDGSNDVSILLGDGTGNLLAGARSTVGRNPASIAVGDFNGDAISDLAVANSYRPFDLTTDDVSILLGHGDGTFAAETRAEVGLAPRRVVSGDFDADGHADLAVYAQSPFEEALVLLRGRGDGTFLPLFRLSRTGFFSIMSGDLNGDGVDDLAGATLGFYGASVAGAVATFLGQAGGDMMSLTPTSSGPGIPVWTVLADFDADGALDFAGADSFASHNYLFDDRLEVLKGTGDGLFSNVTSYIVGAQPDAIATGDFDGDGRSDLAVGSDHTYYGSLVTVLFNVSAGASANRPPEAVLAAQAPVECTGTSGAALTLDGSTSTDADSTPGTNDDIVSFDWFEDYGLASQRSLGSGETLPVTLPLGAHAITLKVTDKAGLSGVVTTTMSVVDTTPPVVDCVAALPAAECQDAGGAYVTVTATAHDACGGATLANDHTLNGGDASGSYQLGTTPVVFDAWDPSGNEATCSTSVTVLDTTPPEMIVVIETPTLWPPNHALIPVHPTWQVHDACDANPNVTLLSVTSSEPDDAPGIADGSTSSDIAGADIGTADGEVELRAERDGNGAGRVYTLTYLAADAAGNALRALAIVTVPHDQGHGPEPLLMQLEPLSAGATSVRVYWPLITGATGYDVITGDLGSLRVDKGVLDLGSVRVLARETAQTTVSETSAAPRPAVGRGFFYLIQQRTAAGAAGYGTETGPWPRVPGACDGGCPGATTTTSSSAGSGTGTQTRR